MCRAWRECARRHFFRTTRCVLAEDSDASNLKTLQSFLAFFGSNEAVASCVRTLYLIRLDQKHFKQPTRYYDPDMFLDALRLFGRVERLCLHDVFIAAPPGASRAALPRLRGLEIRTPLVLERELCDLLCCFTAVEHAEFRLNLVCMGTKTKYKPLSQLAVSRLTAHDNALGAHTYTSLAASPSARTLRSVSVHYTYSIAPLVGMQGLLEATRGNLEELHLAFNWLWEENLGKYFRFVRTCVLVLTTI